MDFAAGCVQTTLRERRHKRHNAEHSADIERLTEQLSQQQTHSKQKKLQSHSSIAHFMPCTLQRYETEA